MKKLLLIGLGFILLIVGCEGKKDLFIDSDTIWNYSNDNPIFC